MLSEDWIHQAQDVDVLRKVDQVEEALDYMLEVDSLVQIHLQLTSLDCKVLLLEVNQTGTELLKDTQPETL